MIFCELALRGAFMIQPERLEDERGFFARSYCAREFELHGLNPRVVQCNFSLSRKRGTLRGIHCQGPAGEEAKLVRCTAGALYDVIVDLRPQSPTYLKHEGLRLDAAGYLMIFVPQGFGHGFITLEDDTEVHYQMSEFYDPGKARGIRWDDPAFGIPWPMEPRVISDRDRSYPDFAG